MKNEPQNHHYISQFLIRKFAIDPSRSKQNQEVFVLHKWTKDIEKKKISEICSMSNFNGEQEKRFSKMERKHFSPSLQKYLDDSHDISDLQNLKRFACILLCSTPSFRQNILRHLTCQLENDFGIPYGSVHIKDYIYGKFDLTNNCANAVFREIEEWEVAYLENNTQGFITSNSPVRVNNEEKGYCEINTQIIMNRQDVKEHAGKISSNLEVKILNADLKASPRIQFSVSPDKILLFAPTTDIADAVISEFKSINGKDLIRIINASTFAYSEEYAISSKRELLEEVKPLINFKTNQFDSMEETKRYLSNR